MSLKLGTPSPLIVGVSGVTRVAGTGPPPGQFVKTDGIPTPSYQIPPRGFPSMCLYLFLINGCGCVAGFKTGTHCSEVLEQLNRINFAEAWTPATMSVLPFTVPESCKPSWSNTEVVKITRRCSPWWTFSCPSRMVLTEVRLPENPDSVEWLFE